MYLNEEAKEMLIDYVLEKDKSRDIDEKFAGFDSIVIALVKNGIVHMPRSYSGEIEDFLCSFNFIEHAGGNEIVTLKIDLERLVSDTGFKKYVDKMISDTQREIRQLMKDADELQNTVSKMSTLVDLKKMKEEQK